jgi:hypothetical protein
LGKKGKQKKKPTAAFDIRSDKTPRLPDYPDPMRRHPSWRISRMDISLSAAATGDVP